MDAENSKSKTPAPNNIPNRSNTSKTNLQNITLILVSLLLSVTVVIRILTLSTPLERDEGEYAYTAQLILRGVPPYKLAYNMKMPGIYAAYAAVIAVFGQTASAVHLGALIINTATTILIFLLTKKLLNTTAAAAAAAFFAITSLSRFVAASANAENFVLLPAITAILLLLKFQENKKYAHLISCAILLGIAFLMKQHAVGFILLGGILILLSKPFNIKKIISSIAIYTFFVSLPFLITCLILWQSGVFRQFWFWTFDYAAKYVSIVPLEIGLRELKNNGLLIIQSAPAIWLSAAIGLLSILWDKNIRKNYRFILLFLICSFAAVCPGMYFRYHYFLLLLPAVCLLAATAIYAAENILIKITKSKNISLAICTAILAAVWMHTLLLPKNCYFQTDPVKLSKLTFGNNSFAEMQEIAKFIRQNSNPNDQIAIMGSEPQIFFYAQRRSASPYIYMYPLMEPQPYARQMQLEMIQHIEQNKPRFFVFVTNNFSWLQNSYSETLIFKWFADYIKNYAAIGLVEVLPNKTIYHWKTNAIASDAALRIYVFERNQSPDAQK